MSWNDCNITMNIDLEAKLKVGRVVKSSQMETMDK